MKLKWITFVPIVFLLLFQCGWATNSIDAGLKTYFKNDRLIINNPTGKAFNLRHANIQFSYFGKIYKVTNVDDVTQVINFSADDSNPVKGKVYSVKIYGTKNVMLLPKKSLQLALLTDKKDAPHDFSVKVAPTPVPVKITHANANWVETIYICNTTSASIPLNNIEFNFNYSAPMPTNIWGTPWVGWKLASQTGGQVVLIGGTPFTPSLPSDPSCMSPLTIQFNAPPTNPEPMGPFVFKSEVGGTPPQTGNLNVMLGASPAAGLANPSLTVSGPSPTQQKTVVWGTTWALTGLTAGTYTVSGATFTSGGQTYVADPKTVTVTANATANTTIAYKLATTSSTVTVTLVNPPTATVPLTLSSASGTMNQTVSNGSVLSLASGTYTVSSSVAGYTATPTPNPLVVPTNKTLSITYSAIPVGGAGSRTVKLVNQCPFPVWFGFISGATKNKTGGEPCGSDADCQPGSVCVDRGGGGTHCFWKNPVPANNNFELAPNGGTNSVMFPYVKTTMNAVWSGAAAGRTNCTAAGCETSDCGGGTGGCPAGKGFMQPTTQIEFTFQTNAVDFYNLSAVDGMNIPTSMAPEAPFDPQKPYDCGTPGNHLATPLTGACTWDFAPPLAEYRWVRAGGGACTSNADCGAGTVCGFSKHPTPPKLRKTCGKLLGWFNANRICAEDDTLGAPFNCKEQLPAPHQAYTMRNMLGCAPIPSCYKSDATPSCCGCANWDKLGIAVPPAPYTEQCGSSNPYWVTRIQPGLEWIKRACPSIYTYAFDDMSSTYTCRVNKTDAGGAEINSTNYTFTFCPGGKTGGIT